MMEDRGEIRALEAEMDALEKDKKAKMDANKRAEADAMAPQILFRCESISKLYVAKRAVS